MHPSEDRLDTATLTLRQRAVDLHEWARLGGILYVVSWLQVAGIGDGWQRYPRLSLAALLLLLGLWAARVLIRRRYQRTPAFAADSLRWQWAVLAATALSWGSLSGWALLDPAFAGARMVTLIATASLAMAFLARLARYRFDLPGGTRLGITARPGLAIHSAGRHADGDALNMAADEALYRAKAAGRNRPEAA